MQLAPIRRGFTLMELLFVIAIIGILSSVVLSSVSTVRLKGVDAAIRLQIDQSKSIAEAYYDTRQPNSYSGVCADSTAGFSNLIAGAQKAGSASVICSDPSTNSADAWVLSAQLKRDPGTYYCIDSAGTVREAGTAQIDQTATACP